jgi:signal transduction histidine kinase
VATSHTLFAASLVAAVGVSLSVESVPRGQPFASAPASLKQLDLLVSALLAASIVLMGRAIVSYEIFTGKPLPRGGLHRSWRNSLILASGFGALVATSLALPTDPIYHLLLATGLMTLLYALLSWRSYAEHERSVERLRPFVTSERLYDRLLDDNASPAIDAQGPFSALCDDVLGSRVAYLAALGPMAPLVGQPLVHARGPTGWEPRCPTGPELSELASRFPSAAAMSSPLDPSRYGGAILVVPLWSERGLIGLLLLGEKVDGALYTQEEIEIARATSERLIDSQASGAMARRLMALQRQWLVESQLLDRRGRRALHDDVLPLLHTAMLVLSRRNGANGEAQQQEATELISHAHHAIADLIRSMPPPLAREVSRRGLVGALRQVLDDELGDHFDAVVWHVDPDAEERASSVPELASEVLFYAAREAIRNAARYGRNGDPGRALRLDLWVRWRDGLEIAIEDDGVGPGATTPLGGGSGHGLALHSTMLAVLGGTLVAERTQDARTRVVAALPEECAVSPAR